MLCITILYHIVNIITRRRERLKKSEIISHLKERRDNLKAERKKDGIRIDEINHLIKFIREDVKKIENDELDDVALEYRITGATGSLLVLELYSLLDDKDYRKLCVKEMIKKLHENKKISNAVYENALDTLED